MKRITLNILLSALLAFSLSSTARGEIAIDADFPGGNIIVDSVENGVAHIRADLRDSTTDWFYSAFRVRGAQGQKIEFVYNGANKVGPRGQAYSVDGGKTWGWTHQGIDSPSDRFVYTFGENESEVLFATSPLYTRENWDSFIKKYQDREGFEPGVLCQARDGSDARMLAIRSTGNGKYGVAFTARHHCCEAVASYALEGLIDAIMTDNENGRFLRQYCEFFVVPFVDEPGVEAGDQGKNRAPHDHNRDYAAEIYPTVKALKSYIVNNFADKKVVFMDWHCPWLRGGKTNEAIYSPEMDNAAMTRELRHYASLLEQAQQGAALPYRATNNLPFGKDWNTAANYVRKDGGVETMPAKNWGATLPNIVLSCDYEIPYANVEGAVVLPAVAREFGRNAAKALANYLRDKEFGRRSFGGIYPHLGYFNNEGECGTGAVVPWADRLWFVTYGPHLPNGSSDKLYELDADLNLTIRPESVGGTNANRMIHRESNQLFIGNHAIDADRNVRTIPHQKMLGRNTAVARHLSDPANKVYYLTMEEGLYEVDVHSLDVKTLWKDGNGPRPANEDVLPGYHGKGGYMTQGRVVYTNNGENSDAARKDPTTPSGCLAEWTEENGWNVVRRNQFTEATGPDGIYGGNGNDVLWTLGWDVRSVILMVLQDGKWSTYRLPKASHCYDGAHGWNTEWPRIRKIDDENDYLATMHGQFWRFPKSFSADKPYGIRPRSTYLKVIGDWAYWNNQVVFGCDDNAKSEFLNTGAFKPKPSGPGISNSNLWFVDPEKLDRFGGSLGRGALWLHDDVAANALSDMYLIGGYDRVSLYYDYEADVKPELTLELCGNDGVWKKITLNADNDKNYGVYELDLSDGARYEWLRVSSNAALRNATCFIHSRKNEIDRATTAIFNGLAGPQDADDFLGARLWTRHNNRRLAVVSQIVKDGKLAEERYYELTEDGRLERVPCPYEGGEQGTISRVKGMVEPQEVSKDVVDIDELGVLVNYGGKRWRLPVGSWELANVQTPLVARLDREVCTERDLFHCAGVFYELPAENAGGFPKIRPIASSGALIVDYASYRGMFVLSGLSPDASNDSDRVVRSEDGKCALWLGAVDDLWELGAARGEGYVWKEQQLEPGANSDPMLATGFDSKRLELVNNGDSPIEIAFEFDPTCEGAWREFQRYTLQPGEKRVVEFNDLPAYWVRLAAHTPGKATALFKFGKLSAEK